MSTRTKVKVICIMWVKFSFLHGNVISHLERIRDGKISPFVTKGTSPFPHSWLSSHSKKEVPHSRLRRSWGNYFSLFLLSHSWGNGDVPFVTHGEIFFPIPNSLQMRYRPIPTFSEHRGVTKRRNYPIPSFFHKIIG